MPDDATTEAQPEPEPEPTPVAVPPYEDAPSSTGVVADDDPDDVDG